MSLRNERSKLASRIRNERIIDYYRMDNEGIIFILFFLSFMGCILMGMYRNSYCIFPLKERLILNCKFYDFYHFLKIIPRSKYVFRRKDEYSMQRF